MLALLVLSASTSAHAGEFCSREAGSRNDDEFAGDPDGNGFEAPDPWCETGTGDLSCTPFAYKVSQHRTHARTIAPTPADTRMTRALSLGLP